MKTDTGMVRLEVLQGTLMVMGWGPSGLVYFNARSGTSLGAETKALRQLMLQGWS
jgi:hypothetical protein